MRRILLHGELGQGVVEFAVIFPVFMLFIFAVIDGGLTMGRYGEVNHAAKEGARLAATGATNNEVVARIRAQSQGVLDSVPAGCGGSEYICVEYADGPSSNASRPGEVGSTVKITIKYNFPGITPLLDSFGGLDMSACAVARLERPVDPDDITSDNAC